MHIYIVLFLALTYFVFSPAKLPLPGRICLSMNIDFQFNGITFSI